MSSKAPRPLAPPASAEELRQRLRGLAPAHAVKLREAMRLHASGDRRGFALSLLQVAALAPDHPEVLYWLGVMHSGDAAWAEAAQALARAAEQRPADLRLLAMLGSALGHAGDAEAAQAAFEQAMQGAGSADEWLALSIECDQQGLYELALGAVESALRLAPRTARAMLQRARCHKALGLAEAAAADCRQLIASGLETARAWFSLLDLKTIPLEDGELRALRSAALQSALSANERQLLDFALGHALEAAGEPEGAFEAFRRANAAARATNPWNVERFGRLVQEIRNAFVAQDVKPSGAQGREVIFIVGMPRSGSTLVEQVLAAHPQVEGASELPYLGQILDAESRRRGRAFPAWVGAASSEDWQRLGRQYLQLSARWRRRRPISTDKLPDNWLYAGAIRAMLPEARIIDCRRDALETAWSCYKQLFAPGLAQYSYDFESLGAQLRACESLCDAWAAAHPTRYRRQQYERLAREPEAEIRDLLDFCGLDFADSCLAFQSASRAIRTPSALQVRQPLRQAPPRAETYGPLLDPLRRALSPG